MKTFSLILMIGSLAIAAFAADVNGTWTGALKGREGNLQEVSIALKADGKSLTGKLSNAWGDFDIENGTLNGNQLSFKVPLTIKGQNISMNFSGKVEGNQMQLHLRIEGPQPMDLDIDLTRKQ